MLTALFYDAYKLDALTVKNTSLNKAIRRWTQDDGADVPPVNGGEGKAA